MLKSDLFSVAFYGIAKRDLRVSVFSFLEVMGPNDSYITLSLPNSDLILPFQDVLFFAEKLSFNDEIDFILITEFIKVNFKAV